MLEDLKQKVWKANLLLPKYNLVTFTWGNVSEYDPKSGYFVIKPSGVAYEEMQASDMVVCDLEGNVVEGDLNPSSDTPTHAYLYKQMPHLGAITHTHSTYATVWAQAGVDLFVAGTTHADNFYGPVPCTRHLDPANIKQNYEHETGIMIAEAFHARGLTWEQMPAVLVNNHGPFTFGQNAFKSVNNAKILEVVSEMAVHNYSINKTNNAVSKALIDKHYYRKHGENAYYGQKLKQN